MIVGLDWPAARAMMPEGVDVERVMALLRLWEHGMIAGSAERSEKQ